MDILTITPSAKQHIDKLCKEHNQWAVSLNIKGGGCAGFEYEWGFTDCKDFGDEVIETDEARLVIGQHSVMFLIGTELDYVNEMFGSHFDIRNPNAQSSCGCGVSVNFDIDQLEEAYEETGV